MADLRVFVLTHEHSDRSAFHVCGCTLSEDVAHAWAQGGDENHVYDLTVDKIASWLHGHRRRQPKPSGGE